MCEKGTLEQIPSRVEEAILMSRDSMWAEEHANGHEEGMCPTAPL